ncbi:MAG: DNA starvation/stationary phase protection protein [Acholeplasmatales bacterium]|jgi:starvation-inducible DNA-binding protein|nr:DNA starvation/stationary phase protection protein [Acholeplasmatales bacterium]
MNKLHESLNKQVANLGVLFTKLRYFHWYVKGPAFYGLHAKFEELYTEVEDLYDTIGERLLALGGNPVANLKLYLELSIIGEAEGEYDAKKMVAETVADLNLLVTEFKEVIEKASKDGDSVTADIFSGAIASYQKHVWMLGAFNK